jgi:hypothetical protein
MKEKDTSQVLFSTLPVVNDSSESSPSLSVGECRHVTRSLESSAPTSLPHIKWSILVYELCLQMHAKLEATNMSSE